MKSILGHDLVRGSVTSCGCTISKGEETIRNILNKYSVNFKTQYSFSDLKSQKQRRLRFDFGLLDKNDKLLALLEYQGAQHYFIEYGYFGKQQREITDKQKRKYCVVNNIPLYEIKYSDNIEFALNNILIKLKLLK